MSLPHFEVVKRVEDARRLGKAYDAARLGAEASEADADGKD